MLFNSNIFLLVFLPIALIGFHLLRGAFGTKTAFVFLFLASMAFYAWWSLPYAALFAASIAVNYAASRLIMQTRSRAITAAAIVGNLLLLGYFKYTNFLIGAVAQFTHTPAHLLNIVLPIGISFYTFIEIAFLVDAYVGKVREPSLARYGLFVSFFPHMLAGPIVHHSEMMPQFAKPKPKRRIRFMIALGLSLLALGLVKKVLIADQISTIANTMFDGVAKGQAPDFFNAWMGALAYTMQIYFDFSGYSDMAIGLALMFGIRFPANFNSPYKTTSIIAFWRRWHMTLSRLLRDYVYIPLGGNRRGSGRRHVNLLATMLIGGAWHGAGWTFILWGGLHGVGLIVNHLWDNSPASRLKIPPALAWGMTFLFVLLAWVPFRAADIHTAGSIYAAMAGAKGLSAPLELVNLARHAGLDLSRFGVEAVSQNNRTAFYISALILLAASALAFFGPNSLQLTARARPVLAMASVRREWRGPTRFAWAPNALIGLAVGVALFVVLKTINSAASSEFLYFQF